MIRLLISSKYPVISTNDWVKGWTRAFLYGKDFSVGGTALKLPAFTMVWLQIEKISGKGSRLTHCLRIWTVLRGRSENWWMKASLVSTWWLAWREDGSSLCNIAIL
jgi:hypothetical protein